MRKRSLAVVALAVSAALCLAACGGSSAGSGSAGSGSGAGGAGASASGSASAAAGTSSKKVKDPADKFVYHTSAELVGFMATYTGTEELYFREPKWKMNVDELSMEGSLTSDKSGFTSIELSYRKKDGNQTQPEEALWSFYGDFCAKTGLSFPEAEESIRGISGLDDSHTFENGPVALAVDNTKNDCSLRMYRIDAGIDNIPYTLSDAEAFMVNVGGESADISRTVTSKPIGMSISGNENYTWEATLDAGDRIRHINAKYYGEDQAEGKAFFTALTEFFLTGDVLKQGQALIDGHYDTIEAKKNEKAEMDKPYSMQLQRRNDYYGVSISVKADNVPADAAVFPSAEELAALGQDPIARLGVDKIPALPETVLLEQDGIKLTLERSYYSTSTVPDLCIVFSGEGIPEDAYAVISVDKINGREIDFEGPDTKSFTRPELYAKNLKSEADIDLAELKELMPDFTKLESVTVSGTVHKDIVDTTMQNNIGFRDITIEAVQ